MENLLLPRGEWVIGGQENKEGNNINNNSFWQVWAF